MKDISRRSFIIGAGATALSLGAVGALVRKGVAVADIKNFDAKWIWPNNNLKGLNDYAEFVDSFTPTSTDDLKIEIACESMYALYINGELRNFAQSSDFPTQAQYKNNEYKLYDKLDIAKYCTAGVKHELRIVIWHNPGNSGTQSYLMGDAGLIYQVLEGNKKLAASNQNTQSRMLECYWHGDGMWPLTPQLGYAFRYDQDAKNPDFTNSTVIEGKSNNFNLREILPLQLEPVVKGKLVKTYEDSLLYDLGKEYVGFLDIQFTNPQDQVIFVAYGEHIEANDKGQGAGHVRYKIDPRKFRVDIQSNGGSKVNYLNPFRRLGCRYLEVFAETKDEKKGVLPTDVQIGIRPVMYPLEDKKFTTSDTELQNIYDACVWTLKCCMHEHYEDCPWREQCLYGMDSRNQMLCGYYTFEGHEYQRHNLILLANSLRNDDLIEICSPCNNEFPIPMFSYAFIMGLCEYIKYTKDRSILKKVDFAVDAIMKKSAAIIKDKGLLAAFNRPPFWNFYEWWPKGGSDEGIPGDFDLNLNTIFIIAHEMLNKMDGRTYTNIDKLRKNLDDLLYDSEKGEYKLSDKRDATSHLGNATAILAGLPHADKTLAKKIAADMVEKRKSETAPGMVRASLSMKAFVYDALLSFNDADLKNEVLTDIKYFWGTLMLKSPYWTGTFWEDEEGQLAFGNAGSLCHGWSAIPVYYIQEFFS